MKKMLIAYTAEIQLAHADQDEGFIKQFLTTGPMVEFEEKMRKAHEDLREAGVELVGAVKGQLQIEFPK